MVISSGYRVRKWSAISTPRDVGAEGNVEMMAVGQATGRDPGQRLVHDPAQGGLDQVLVIQRVGSVGHGARALHSIGGALLLPGALRTPPQRCEC